MMTKQEQYTISNYDKMSRWYDLLAGSSEQPFRQNGLSLLDPQPGEKILDLGCGTGSTLPVLSKSVGTSGFAVGLDLSLGMLGQAKKGKMKDGISPTLIQGSILSIPCLQGYFDAGFMSFTLELLPDHYINKALQEIYRCLKPTGRLVVISMAVDKKQSLVSRLYQWAHEHYPQICDCRPIESQLFLETNGFVIQKTIHRSMWGLPVNIHTCMKDY